MTCGREHYSKRAVLPAQVRGACGHEAAAELLGQHDLVGVAQYLRRISIPVRQYPDRMPGRRGSRGRVLALAAHIADGHAPAAWCRVDVVEVASHLPAARWHEMRGGDLLPRAPA